jgi:SagB-type dehydrogenase family enzyme
VTPIVPTAEFASLVYGVRGVPVDDPAEAFHEASRLYPNVAPAQLATLLALARSPELQQTTARSSRARPHLPTIDLPRGALPRARLADLLGRRRSALGERRTSLRLADLAAVLSASYAVRSRRAGESRRPVPSGGALYPLELYVVAMDVEGLEPSTLHYDPFRHRLERLGSVNPTNVREALVDPTLADRAATLVVITAMFWRSRFKYGLRGYRFALIEAGHVVQNALLTAAGLLLPALPLGGFYDRRLEELVGANGLDEAAVYAFLLGGRP